MFENEEAMSQLIVPATQILKSKVAKRTAEPAGEDTRFRVLGFQDLSCRNHSISFRAPATA